MIKNLAIEFFKATPTKFLSQVFFPIIIFVLKIIIQSIKSIPLEQMLDILALNPQNDDDFFKKLNQICFSEFPMSQPGDLLDFVYLEVLLEKKFIEFLTNYKKTFDTLQRPFRKEEYVKFIETREKPLKTYFQYLKVYLQKWLPYSEGTYYELYFLTKEYDGCSICDIFTISDDYSLKYHVFVALFRIQAKNFYEIEPKDQKTTHYRRIYDCLSFYANVCDEKKEWLDFEELYSADTSKRNVKILKILINEEEKNFKNIDLFSEFQNYSKIMSENEYLISPTGFSEFLIKNLNEGNPKLKIDFKIKETIKMVASFFFLDDFSSIDTNQEFKNNLFYFYLTCFIVQEIAKTRIFNFL